MSKITKAIFKINSEAKFSMQDTTDYNSISWEDTTPISKSDIEAQFPTVELEIALEDLRIKRNELLTETDYLALSDNTLSSDMTTYRQDLRDLTEGLTTVAQVEAVVFPTKP